MNDYIYFIGINIYFYLLIAFSFRAFRDYYEENLESFRHGILTFMLVLFSALDIYRFPETIERLISPIKSDAILDFIRWITSYAFFFGTCALLMFISLIFLRITQRAFWVKLPAGS